MANEFTRICNKSGAVSLDDFNPDLNTVDPQFLNTVVAAEFRMLANISGYKTLKVYNNGSSTMTVRFYNNSGQQIGSDTSAVSLQWTDIVIPDGSTVATAKSSVNTGAFVSLSTN